MKFEKTEYFYNIKDLVDELPNFTKYFNQVNQLSLKYDPTQVKDIPPHLSCIGRSSLDILNWNFTEISPIFVSSAMIKVVEQIQQPTKRIRLMAMPPRTCYSLHADLYRRLHWAILTYPGCHMSFQEQDNKFAGFHIPADGYGYLVDTRTNHTAVNPSDKIRYHLVIDIM